jgi:glycerate 2-kinase
LTKHALSIFRAALKAADPVQAVLRHVRVEGSVLIADKTRYRLEHLGAIYVVGAGKASASMAQAVERLLGKRITSGAINVKYGHGANLKRIEVNECGHPVPDQAGLQGAQRIADIANRAGERDLVICLISGGASALLPLPVPPVTLDDKQRLTQLLLECGANIHEMNCLRKHLSLVKGGQLAKLVWPARVLTLVLSDVIGDDLDTIGSGPTVADRSTFADASGILTRYGLWDQAPEAVAQHVREARDETPKAGDPVFERVQNLIVGSNGLAVDAAAARAKELGYRTLVLSTSIEGETREVARMHAAIAREVLASGRPVKAPVCIISGGETTVTIRGNGLGGRNQEFALAAALDIQGLKDVVVLSGGTDGTDGPTDAAGGIVDGTTVHRGKALGLDAREYLAKNDSYHFLERTAGLVKTGPTRTNVMDVRLLLIT